MKKSIKKNRLLFLAALFGAVIVILLLTLRTRQEKPTPAPALILFKLEQVFPSEGKQEIVIPNFAIHFTFSKPIDVAATAVKIEPFMDFEISTDDTGRTLFIMPVPEWKFNTEYKMTISTKSEDGQILSSPVEYLFEPIRPTTSDLDEVPR